MKKYYLAEEIKGYVTASDDTNSSPSLLVNGSQNVQIDRNLKVKTRAGYTRLGAGNASNTPCRNSFTWHTSTGGELPLRFYDDEWEVYLGTVDSTAINAWTRIKSSMSDTTIPRSATWWDNNEGIDLLLLVQGDDNIYEWSGAVAVVSSITGTTVTKAGTTTFSENRFYSVGSKTVVCTRTGTEYTYSGGESTTTLTGIADTTGLIAGDILIQKVVTNSDEPAANRNNHTIFNFNNHICLGSADDELVYISKQADFTDFTYSTPRVAGEGGLLTLDSPVGAFFSLGDTLIVSAGRSSFFKAKFSQITVSTTLAETLTVQKLFVGVDQGVFNPETLVQMGDSITYLSYEPAVRMITDPGQLEGLSPKTLSNPIKPDFDAETWTGACATWYKNTYYLSSPVNSKLYMLNFVENADGNLRRYWNPPQIMPVRSFSVINNKLYTHSNGVPETYELFSGVSDIVPNGTAGDPESKLPMNAIAAYAYNLYGDRAVSKTFSELFSDGEITPNSNILVTVNYDYGGSTAVVERTISGSDEDILTGAININSLGQQNLGINPLGSLLNAPSDARKFETILEYAPEDFRMLQVIFYSNSIDQFWGIVSFGTDARLSSRRNIKTHK